MKLPYFPQPDPGVFLPVIADLWQGTYPTGPIARAGVPTAMPGTKNGTASRGKVLQTRFAIPRAARRAFLKISARARDPRYAMAASAGWLQLTVAALLSGGTWLWRVLEPVGTSLHAISKPKGQHTSIRRRSARRKNAPRVPTTPNPQTGGSAETPPRDERLLITAGVTHELRTPLTILKGRLHGIADGVICPDENETARLLRQVEHVLAIVNDLDTLAKADLGHLSLQRCEIDLAQIVGAVVSDLHPLLARHGMEIVERYEKVRLLADPTRVTQIVTNLLTNASKHSAVGGKILVDVDLHQGEARLSVLDEGPGFLPADKDRLFTPFWRSDATIRRVGCTGTGMGLALTAKLVAAHGGQIFAENRQDRSGACFSVTLPIV